MGRKFGFSFSWKRASGISGIKNRVSRKIGIPLTKQGRQKKVGRAAGCFIATVAYGDYNSANVKFLRTFRDEILEKHFVGRFFIQVYYRIGPSLALWVDRSTVLKYLSRKILDTVIKLIEACTSLKIQDHTKNRKT